MLGKEWIFSDLQRVTTAFIKDHWIRFIKLTLVFFVPLEILDNYFWDNTEFAQKIIAKYAPEAIASFVAVMIVLIFLYFLLYLIAVMKMIHAFDQGKNPSTVYSYRQALKIFWPYLWVKCRHLFKFLCWSMLFVIPGIIFGIYYNFSGMTFLIDGKRGKEALILSKNIIKPNLWKYLVSVFLTVILVSAYCVLFIFSFDNFNYIFKIKGYMLIAQMIDYCEIAFLSLAGFYFLTFYYYFYKGLTENSQF